MMKCNKCKIEYSGSFIRCPLCQTELVGKKEDSIFPKIQTKEKLLYKILLFVSFAIGVLFAFIEHTILKSFSITKFVVFGLITNYILIKFILHNYKNVLKTMNKYFWLLLLLFFIWHFATKSMIITTYIISILCITIFVFNSIVMIILKNSYIIKFVKTIILNCCIGLIPLLLVWLNLTTFDLISYICAILDLIFFVGLLIFCKDNVIEELKKIFNF